MSDTSQGPGWWQASDGRWYRPEQHPDHVPPPPPIPPPVPPPIPPVPPPPPLPYGTPMVPGPFGYTPWPGPMVPPVTSGLAIAALVLSIVWIGGLGSVAAVV